MGKMGGGPDIEIYDLPVADRFETGQKNVVIALNLRIRTNTRYHSERYKRRYGNAYTFHVFQLNRLFADRTDGKATIT